MAHLIDKSALVAEIENLLKPVKQRLERDRNDPWDSDIAVYKFGKQLMKNIDTLEVKEVDLEKEIAKYLGDDWVQDTPKEVQLDMIGYAKHFFELGMQQSKNYNNNEE